jgi:hypothetical protein
MPDAEANGDGGNDGKADKAEGAEDGRGNVAEEVRREADRRCPGDTTERIPQQERAPGHVVGTSKPRPHHAEAGHPACKEDGPGAVTFEERLTANEEQPALLHPTTLTGEKVPACPPPEEVADARIAHAIRLVSPGTGSPDDSPATMAKRAT